MPLRQFDTSRFWNFISKFFTYLDDYSHDMFENFWFGLHLAGDSLRDRADRFLKSTSPELTYTDVQESYYEIVVGPLYSVPMKLDPTDINSNYTITPVSRVEIEPYYVETTAVYSDLIEISARDYYKIRDVGIGMYIVVHVDRDEVNDKAFKINNLKSSEEDESGNRYYKYEKMVWDDDTSSYIPDTTSFKYMIELEAGNLSYIGDDNFTIYLTNAKAYKTDVNITEIPTLQSNIGIWPKIETTKGSVYAVDQDYTFNGSIVEFNNDIFEYGDVVHGDTLYCPLAPTIENNLFTQYGGYTGIDTAARFAYNNVTAKAGISSAIKSLQNTSSIDDYERALNAFYGLSIAPQNCKVIGLYESYDYKVTDRSGNEITLELKEEVDLHPFFQEDSIIRLENHEERTVASIVNRTTGVIELNSTSGITIGDTLNLKLKNKYLIKSILEEAPTVDGHVKIYSDVAAAHIKHIIDMIHLITGNAEHPEILIYGTSGFTYNYDNVYHMTDATDSGAGEIQIDIYNPANDYEPKYNDFLFNTSASMDVGFVHIPWPTHKYLLLLLEDGTYHKAYIDAPLDTIYDENDDIPKYTQLCRNVSAINNSFFPNWNEFDGFRRFNGIDKDANILELVNVLPNVKFGSYFPANYSEIV